MMGLDRPLRMIASLGKRRPAATQPAALAAFEAALAIHAQLVGVGATVDELRGPVAAVLR